MLGHTHAQGAMTAWTAVTTLAPIAGVHLRWQAMAAGTLACAGAGLLPDLDHPQATCAQSFGLVSKALTRAVHRISGGHRHATHSLLFACVSYAVTAFGVHRCGALFALPLMFVLYVFAIRGMHLAPGLSIGAAAVALGVSWLILGGNYTWLPDAVLIGVLAHLAGDCLTKEGCPLFWPWETHFTIPLIQRTGNRLETMLVGPLFAFGTVAIFVFAR